MADSERLSRWQDWTLFGLRWVFLIGISLAVLIHRSQVAGGAVEYQDLAIAFAVGSVINLLTLSAAFAQVTAGIVPYLIILGDWTLAVLYAILTQGQAHPNEPILLMGLCGTLIIAGTLRLGPALGAMQAVGVIVIALFGVLYARDITNFDLARALITDTYALPLVVLIVLACVAGLWVYVQYERTQGSQQSLSSLATSKSQQIEEMRQRTRALSDMTNTLSATVDFNRILDAVLGLGQLALRSQSNKNRSIGMVLLFRASEETMYVANSRGLSHIDEHKTIYGQDGILAATLNECMPMIGKDAFKDPELRTLNAFMNIRSVLVIPLRARFENYGLLVFGSDAANAYQEDQVDVLNAIGIQAAVALQNAALYAKLMEEREKIVQLEENARSQFVHDLHDGPAQIVAAVKVRLSIVQRLLERNPDQVVPEIRELEEMAQRASDEIRHVMFQLHPLALESQGFTAALEQLAEKTQKTFHQPVRVQMSSDIDRYLDKNQQGALFNLIQEAVTNARKYAQAELITIQGAQKNGVLIIRISDNGVGFDPSVRKNDGRDHIGLGSMRERAELLDGTLGVDSAPGRGTRITVKVPVDLARSRDGARSARASIPETRISSSTLAFEEFAR
jgi:signal transduction histidine kinase